MYIIIDDIRDLNCDIICRTGKAGIAVLEAMQGQFDVLCIDHDLGDADEMNGYDVIKYTIDCKLLPDEVQIVSSNPVGIQNIANALKSAGFVSDLSGRVFKRM